VNGLARLLATRTLMDSSVNRTRSNRGSATPGVDGETLDGLSIERINGWVRSMVEGSYRAKPVKLTPDRDWSSTRMESRTH